jgi:hypothetical protein
MEMSTACNKLRWIFKLARTGRPDDPMTVAVNRLREELDRIPRRRV